jgi:tetratricopeptide (TPR) repeat protein
MMRGRTAVVLRWVGALGVVLSAVACAGRPPAPATPLAAATFVTPSAPTASPSAAVAPIDTNPLSGLLKPEVRVGFEDWVQNILQNAPPPEGLEEMLKQPGGLFGDDEVFAPAQRVNLAGIYRIRGDFAHAEALYLEALPGLTAGLGERHPLVATALGGLAATRLARGMNAEALASAERAAEIWETNLDVLLSTGSEDDKRRIMDALAETTEDTISLHAWSSPASEGAARLALTTLLRRKGRVLDVISASLAALRGRLGDDGQRLLDGLATTSAELAAMLRDQPSVALSTKDYRARLESLELRRQGLEAEINRRDASREASARLVTVERVQVALPADAALLEIARYRPVDPKVVGYRRFGPPRYVAYVLHREGAIGFADLGDAAILDAAAARLRSALGRATGDVFSAARALDTLVFGPLRAAIGATRRIYVSPDGALGLVPFEALMDEEGRFRIERWSFTYLSAGRDLLRFTEHAPSREGALVLADPDFGALREPSAVAARGLRAIDLAGAKFAPLAGSALEGRAVTDEIPGARLLVRAQATKTALVAARGPRVLHLATHGYFLEDPDLLRSGTGPTAEVVRVDNPLLRSGLAFAGANAHRSADGDDGVLSGLEAAALDLRGTRLVVLSACDTGVGEIRNGDGVHGLRRAFAMAGAEALVMSLWDVDDAATRALMSGYYQRLAAGGGRSEALRQARLGALALGIALLLTRRRTRRLAPIWYGDASVNRSPRWRK